MQDVYLSEEEVRNIAGLVVPVWFAKKTSSSLARKLLSLTLDNYHQYLQPENVCLVVDGDERSFNIARSVQETLATEWGEVFHLLYLKENKGKHYAVTEGILRLLANRTIDYFVVADCDADHFICDLPNLVRSAYNISASEKTDRVLIVGRRIDRHRPLGFRRGQLEELCNRVLLDAMNYRLAKRDRVLNTRYYSPYGDVPDFKSGYKVYSRRVASLTFKRNPRFLCLSPKDYWRNGSEPIPIVEAIMAGAVLGEMNRTAFDGQPTTTFTESSAIDMHIKTLAWAFCRLRVPLSSAEQMFDNHIPRLLLASETTGKEQLCAVKRGALTICASFLGRTYSEATATGRPRFF